MARRGRKNVHIILRFGHGNHENPAHRSPKNYRYSWAPQSKLENTLGGVRGIEGLHWSATAKVFKIIFEKYLKYLYLKYLPKSI